MLCKSISYPPPPTEPGSSSKRLPEPESVAHQVTVPATPGQRAAFLLPGGASRRSPGRFLSELGALNSVVRWSGRAPRLDFVSPAPFAAPRFFRAREPFPIRALGEDSQHYRFHPRKGRGGQRTEPRHQPKTAQTASISSGIAPLESRVELAQPPVSNSIDPKRRRCPEPHTTPHRGAWQTWVNHRFVQSPKPPIGPCNAPHKTDR